MANKCNIIKDILPLYAENMVSSDTADFVEEHLRECEKCREEFEQTREPQEIEIKQEATPLINLKRKMFLKKVQTVALTVILVITLLISAFAFLDAPEYLPYSPELVKVTTTSNGIMTLTFDEKVTDFNCSSYFDPDAEIKIGNSESGSVYIADSFNIVDSVSDSENITVLTPAEKKGGYFYHIEAWTSTWDRWFSGRGSLSTTIQMEKNVPYNIYYNQNNGEEDVLLSIHMSTHLSGGEQDDGTFVYYMSSNDLSSVTTLPNLALGYYLIIAVAVLALLFALKLILRKKERIRVWADRALLYPASYIISHLCIMGVHTVTYSMQRDFFLILFVSVLLYCGMLLALNIYNLRKEIKSINTK